MLLLTDDGTDLAALRAAALALADSVRVARGSAAGPGPETAQKSHEVEIPVHYDGPDLDDVAALTGLSRSEVVAAHTGRPWRVAFGGFAPGFAYLVGGDPRLRVPRRDRPAPVGARRVGRAGRRVLRGVPAVVPRWLAARRHHVGRAVRRRPRPTRPARPGHDGALRRRGRTQVSALEVLATGALVLVEDTGRPGLAAVGVGRSGAADRTAHRLGARLVGHPEDRASPRGAARWSRRPGPRPAHPGRHRCAGTRDPRRPAGGPRDARRACPTVASSRLGMPATGLRTYLTVRGGIDVPPVLGSRSADTLSGLGPPAVRVGDVLPVGAPGDRFPTVDHAAQRGPRAGRADAARGAARPAGGRGSVAGRAGLGGLLEVDRVVAGDSDRVGLRLHGDPVQRVGRVAGRRAAQRGPGARRRPGAPGR